MRQKHRERERERERRDGRRLSSQACVVCLYRDGVAAADCGGQGRLPSEPCNHRSPGRATRPPSPGGASCERRGWLGRHGADPAGRGSRRCGWSPSACGLGAGPDVLVIGWPPAAGARPRPWHLEHRAGHAAHPQRPRVIIRQGQIDGGEPPNPGPSAFDGQPRARNAAHVLAAKQLSRRAHWSLPRRVTGGASVDEVREKAAEAVRLHADLVVRASTVVARSHRRLHSLANGSWKA